jgi:hypothetical protein
MKFRTSKTLLGILVVGLAVLFGSSSGAMGQGRGRRSSHWDKKCEKFVNCHDARDGRWDGRGPNHRTGFTNDFRRHRRNRDFDNSHRRNRDFDNSHRRNRDFDNISRRGRHRNRDFSHNRYWRRNR